MSIVRITLEWRPVVGSNGHAGHLVLVAREAGQTNGAGYAISGNASLYKTLDAWNYVTGSWGVLEVNQGAGAGTALSATVDAYSSGKTESQNNANDITNALIAAGNGKSLTEIWDMMCDFANQIGQQEYIYDPGPLFPVGVGTNSNSLISSVLSLAGLDIDQHVIGSLPSQGFPGSDTILTGSDDDYLRGFSGHDVFKSSGGGNDVLHGGDGTIVRSSLGDGRDTVLYYGYTAVTIKDEGNYWSVDKTLDSEEYVDTLYSIESFGNKVFRILNKVDFADASSGKHFKDATDSDIDDAMENVGDGVASFMRVDVDGVEVELFNFGTYIGTASTDRFDINQIIGRVFDGGNQKDVIDYSEVNDTFGVNMRPDQRIAYAASAPSVTDSIQNIETVVGAQEHTNTFVGASGSLDENDPTFTGGAYFANNWGYSNLLTYIGGSQSDTYEFDFEQDKGVVYIRGNGLDDTDRVEISNVPPGWIDETNSTHHGFMVLQKLEKDGDNIVSFSIFREDYLTGQSLQLRISSDIEEIEINGLTIGMANLMMSMHYNSGAYYVAPLDGYVSFSIARLYDTVYNSGPISNGENYDENLAPTFDGNGQSTGIAVSSAIGGTWTAPNIATESHHGWVVTGVASDSGYTTLNTVSALKEIFFAEGITAEDVRFTATASGGLGIHIDSLNYSLNVDGFESGRTINGIGFYDSALHAHVSSAAAVSLKGTGPGQYKVQLSSETSYTPDTVSGTYFLEALNFADSTVIDLLNEPLTFKGSALGETLYGLNTRGDIIFGFAGNDIIYGYGGADVLYGGDGADALHGGEGNDTLYGDGGIDALYGGEGNDVLYGGDGNDSLNGENGNDTLHGGAGNDNLRGGAGDDTYVFAREFSTTTAGDIIYENAADGFDTIFFTDGIQADEVYSWTDTSGFLWMQVGSAAATNTLKAQGSYVAATGITTRIEQVVFDDETVWDLTQGLHLRNNDTARALYGTIYADTIEGGSAADNIYGLGGNDILIGHGGNDALRGGAGDDTYVFGRNFSGTVAGDIIYESADEGNDTIFFTDGIQADEVYSWTDTSGFLWMQVGSTAATNTLKAQGSYAAATGIATRIEQVVFDDETVWDLTQGLHLRNNDTARTFYGTVYGDTLEGGSASDHIYGLGGNDTLIGHGGNDTLRGGDGDDTYIFAPGFSLNATGDRVIETATGGTDTIRFTGGIDAGDVYSWTDTSGYLWLQLGTNSATNTLKVDGAYSASTGITAYVENIAFDDATVWDLTQGLYLRNNDTGRQMYGSVLDDWIEGGAGADTLRGFAGDDILIGRGGNDALYGGSGADTFVFRAADVGNGIDTLHDFSMGDNDVIDLRDVLYGAYDPLNDLLSDFVQFTNAGSHSQMKVDLDGAGAVYGWTHIATVNGHTNLDAATLEANGYLLVV